MINSILDTDLYKFTVSHAYFSLFPLAEGTFKFQDRAKEKHSDKFISLMKSEIKKLANLKLTKEELNWCIANIPYVPANYWEWLSGFQFDPEKIDMYLDSNGVFQCEVTDKMYKVTLYEIPILATYAEVRNMLWLEDNGIVFRSMYTKDGDYNLMNVVDVMRHKIGMANNNGIMFSEFGTRRRFSYDVQEAVIKTIKKESKTCLGTSNVHFAMNYGLKPSGTFPHEWIMFHACCFGYKRANYLGLEDWANVYHGDLGIALIDTYTTDSFLRTLTKKQACLFNGFRQDSGDERVVFEKIIARLTELGIDPKSKVIVFSNALDMNKAKEIKDYVGATAKASFGIGTNLTCDMNFDTPTKTYGFKPTNIVMKLDRARMSHKDPWEEALKISDDLGKVTPGKELEFDYARHALHLTVNEFGTDRKSISELTKTTMS